MDDIVFAGNRALYLILVMSAGPIAVATFVGLLVGLFQTVTQLQEQTLPFGVKLLCVSICFFLMSGWYGEKLYSFGIEMLNLAFARGCYSARFLPIGTNFLFVTIFRQWEYTNSSPSSNNNSGIMCISSALPL